MFDDRVKAFKSHLKAHILTDKECAKRLGICVGCVRQLLKKGTVCGGLLRKFKIKGNAYYWPDVARLIADRFDGIGGGYFQSESKWRKYETN